MIILDIPQVRKPLHPPPKISSEPHSVPIWHLRHLPCFTQLQNSETQMGDDAISSADSFFPIATYCSTVTFAKCPSVPPLGYQWMLKISWFFSPHSWRINWISDDGISHGISHEFRQTIFFLCNMTGLYPLLCSWSSLTMFGSHVFVQRLLRLLFRKDKPCKTWNMH